MDKYRLLKKDEEILESDDMLDCGNDNYNNEGVWVKAPSCVVGKKASDPQYPAHTQYRRKINHPSTDKH